MTPALPPRDSPRAHYMELKQLTEKHCIAIVIDPHLWSP